MRKLNFLILFISMAFACSLYGQLPEQYENIKSPNSSSLGQYGDIPVSHFTGTPDIGIELYGISVSGRTIPVSLNYHTSGIKPDTSSGWVGTGWTLNFGGCISRKVNGLYDEASFWDNRDGNYKKQGYLYVGHQLDGVSWDTETRLKELFKKGVDLYDTEPDEFYFNFLGVSGVFALDSKGEWKVRCQDNVKVVDYMTGSVPFVTNALGSHRPDVITGFILQDSRGVRYTFGYDFDAVELAIDFFNQDWSYWQSSAWYLTKIEFPQGEEVCFQYERGDFTNQIWYSVANYNVGARGSGLIEYNEFINSNITFFAQGNLITPVFLKSVVYPNGRIDLYSINSRQLEYGIGVYQRGKAFNASKYNQNYYYICKGLYNDSKKYMFSDNPIKKEQEKSVIFGSRLKSRQLDSIVVRNNDGVDLRSIKLFYEKDNIFTPTHRLYLERVISGDELYVFSYKDLKFVPGYLSQRTDHWGFLNKDTDSLINMSDIDLYYKSREPDPKLMSYGALNKIIYPTRGYTEFEYEPNECGYVLDETRTKLNKKTMLAGGIRVKRITSINYDGSVLDTRTFFYTAGGDNYASAYSSGILGGLPKYKYSNYNLKSADGQISGHVDIYFSSNSTNYGGMNALGSQIGYSSVVEVLSDGSRIEYRYSNFDTNLDDPAEAMLYGTRTESAKYSSKEMERGLLLSKKHYDCSNKLTYSESNNYGIKEKSFVPAVYSRNYFNTKLQEASSYKIYTYLPRLNRSRTAVHYEGDSIVNEILIDYNSYCQPVSLSKSVGSNEAEVTEIDYLWESDASAKSGFLLVPETQRREYIVSSGSKKLKSVEGIAYQKINPYLYAPVNIVTSTQGYADCDTVRCGYDSYGHLIYQEKSGGKGTVFLWGHSSQYLVAKIENADTVSVKRIIGKFDDFARQLKPDYGKITELRKELGNSAVTSYHYIPGIGLSSTVKPDGKTEYYGYDKFGRLEYILDETGQIVKAYKYNYKRLE